MLNRRHDDRRPLFLVGCSVPTYFRVTGITPLVITIMLVSSGLAFPSTATGARPMPKFSAVRKTVLAHFAALEDEERDEAYQSGDLITQSQAAPVFTRLKRLGWVVADQKDLLARIPADEEFLAQSLRSSAAGRRFMRQVARYPRAYDWLGRVAELPQGRRTVEDLIRGPDGYKMVEYALTTDGGRELGRMLAATPGGGEFQQPTGRIHTVEQMLDALETSHRLAAAR